MAQPEAPARLRQGGMLWHDMESVLRGIDCSVALEPELWGFVRG